jgi:hypothetical protein
MPICPSVPASLQGLGYAIARAEIPTDYAALPILGHGATSIALAQSDDTVVLLTRDPIKAAWSEHALGARRLDPFRSRHPTLRPLNRFPILPLVMPRLYPLAGPNVETVQSIIAEHVGVVTAAWIRHRDRGDQVRAVLSSYRAQPDHAFHSLAMFLRRYRWFQADLDLTPQNFLQTQDGEIRLTDPVIMTRLQTVLERYRPAA